MISRPPRLHVIATGAVAADERLALTGGRLLECCGPGIALHIRLRGAPARRTFELASSLTAIAEEAGAWLVVNERLDIALAAAAQAVQLGRDAIGVEDANRLAGGHLAVGASVHSGREAERAAEAGADYLVVGTIYPTVSHPGRPGAGPELIRRCASGTVVNRARTPLLAIGGIDADRIAAVADAGAYGVAVVRAVWDSEDPVRAAARLSKKIEGAFG